MVKYFSFPVVSVCGLCYTDREALVKEINAYVEVHCLKIVQIFACDDNGLFVVFEKLKRRSI